MKYLSLAVNHTDATTILLTSSLHLLLHTILNKYMNYFRYM